jgi:glycerate kinase
MARGVRRAAPQAELVLLPVADGGDGLLEVLEDALQVERLPLSVTGPLNSPVGASFLYDPSRRLAVIEMATAAGLALLTPDRYNPLDATSFGVGELVKAALDQGAARIILGIGGSATNDGGTGMARALGARFLDQDGNELPGDGASLAQVNNISLDGLDPRLGQVDIQVISDVDNPLLGEHGAARVFAPQKGASPEQVIQLEAGLAQLADVIEQDLGQDVRELPGAGAAGGLGAGLIAFLQAELTPGAELVLELLELKQALAGADLVLTAEGQLDEQTRHGKAPAAVATRARALGIPCLALAGSLGPGSETLLASGIDASFSLCPGPVNPAQAMQEASQYLAAATEQVLRCFLAGYNTRLPAPMNQKTSP